MKKIAMFGRILPERAIVGIGNSVPGALAAGQSNIIVSFKRSQVQVTANWYEEEIDLLTFRNAVVGYIHVICDSVGFMNKCGYDVEIISCIEIETGDAVVFGVDENIDISNDLAPIDFRLNLAFADVEFRFALVDFREAMRMADNTSFHCYRAVESIRNSLAPDLGTGAAWDHLRNVLNVKRETIDEITNLAQDRRHGKVVDQPWPIRKRHLEIAHEIIRRFEMLKQSNATELDKTKFKEF